MGTKYQHAKRQPIGFIIAVACGLWIRVAGLAVADPVGLVTVDKTSAAAQGQGLQTCNVYVQFDDPADRLLSIGFADISTDAPGGFYQNQSGSDLAPNIAWCAIPFPGFELLCSDSFVTIGKKDSAGNTTMKDPDFSTCGFNCPTNSPPCPGGSPPCGTIVGGWFNSSSGGPCPGCPEDINGDGIVNPPDLAILLGSWGDCPPTPPCPADLNGDGVVDAYDLAQLLDAGEPLNANGAPDADLRVLVAQLTVGMFSDVSGSLTVFTSDGPAAGMPYEFTCSVCSCADLPDNPACEDGNPCTDDICDVDCMCFSVYNTDPCYDDNTCTVADQCSAGACTGVSADLTNNGTVGAEDLALLLGAWGANPGHPADLNGDGSIGPTDLALLLGAWGACS